jgi:phage gp46-like protein
MTKFNDRFSGDPAIKMTPGGATIVVRGGQPEMDRGLENTVLLALFVEKGWWGNELFDNKTQRIGSDFENVARRTMTVSTLLNAQSAGYNAIKDLVDKHVANDIRVVASNPRSNTVDVTILIEPPGRDVVALSVRKHGDNWIAQKLDPAHERI